MSDWRPYEPSRDALGEFYILSLKWTRRENVVTWWRSDHSGYTYCLEFAGRYSAQEVAQSAGYLDNRDSTLAVPCDLVEKWSNRVILDCATTTLLTALFGRPTTLVGSTVDDRDFEGNDQCPRCERGFGSPGPSRILHYENPGTPTKEA